MTSAGRVLLQASLLGNVALVLLVLSVWEPLALRNAASILFYWEHDPDYALWSFYGLVVSLVCLVAELAARNIQGSAAALAH